MVWVLDSSTRLVPEGVYWSHKGVLGPTWQLPPNFRDGKAFIFLVCVLRCVFLPSQAAVGILAADAPNLSSVLHVSSRSGPAPRASSAVTSHCTADSQPSCIPNWVRVETSGFPPCHCCQKHARLPFPPLLHIC